MRVRLDVQYPHHPNKCMAQRRHSQIVNKCTNIHIKSWNIKKKTVKIFKISLWVTYKVHIMSTVVFFLQKKLVQSEVSEVDDQNWNVSFYLMLHFPSCFSKIFYPLGPKCSDTGDIAAAISIVRILLQSLENYIRHMLEPLSSWNNEGTAFLGKDKKIQQRENVDASPYSKPPRVSKSSQATA